ncbi:Putative Ca2+/H+ antiporter, TMEM165/GDT1 family [Amphritea atlantica]|uniref:GDT1 family protein n=1 Tax=Amphritea atlantica TaxID=355243 RepID=A0A1H9LTG9_9GAMM|nr:TMEM165/GDT1 family protein [Amphritea atlantica]SER14495.1 Putative Ca2+/H+ antiporter, TMEM165/GDT1 family [Amphritea atlantica]
MDQLVSMAGAFLLVFLAEFGDKSQLVCMTLATRYRALPVLLGAVVAFAVLNLLAVLVGSVAATWLPRPLVLTVVALLFLWFGIQSFRNGEDDEDDSVAVSVKSVFLSVLLMLFLAELGDKTQLAVMGLASTEPALPVWIGATLALISTSALGILAGRALMRYVSIAWLHRASGGLFLVFALYAGAEAVLLVAG